MRDEIVADHGSVDTHHGSLLGFIRQWTTVSIWSWARCAFRFKAHEALSLRFLDSQIEGIWEDLSGLTSNGNGICQYSHSYFISHELNHVDDVKAHTCTSNARSPQEMERGQEDQFFRHEFCSHSPSKSSVYLTIEKWRSPMENASHSISQFNTIHSCSHIQIQQTNPSKMTVPSTPPKPNMEPEKSPLWKNLFIFQIVILGFHLSFGATLFPTCFFVKRFG